MRFEEFLNGIGIPFCDGQNLLDIPVQIEQFDCWLQSPQIFDLQIWEFGWTVTLAEGLYLWIGTEFTGANFENGLRVASR